MLQPQQIEDLVLLVASMERDALIEQFHNYRAKFPLDFTDDFLRTAPLERLRHIFVAVCLQSQHLPTMIDADAA